MYRFILGATYDATRRGRQALIASLSVGPTLGIASVRPPAAVFLLPSSAKQLET